MTAVVLFIAAVAVHIYISSMEAQGGQGRIHWFIAIAYRLGGKPAAVLTLAIPGAVCLLLGLAGMLKTAAAPWPCPDCGGDIPRKATTREQVWWGGGTCPECGCEVDRHGHKKQPIRTEPTQPRARKADSRAKDDDDSDSAGRPRLPSECVRPGTRAGERNQRIEHEEEDHVDDEHPSQRTLDRPRRRRNMNDSSERRRVKNPPTPALMYWLIGGGVGVLLLGSICLGVLLSNDPAPVLEPAPINNAREIPKIKPDKKPNRPAQNARTEIVGGAFDKVFEDRGPEGAVLIGFEIGMGKFLNLDVVHAVQPIYRTPQGEVRGQKHGTDFSRPVLIVAKPGYAVGALDTKAGLIVNGFSATFMRVRGADLDPADSYISPWVGDATGGRRRVLAGDGSLIIGVIGKHNDKSCTGIGLLRASQP
ncbi:MAG: hypothetical protein FJ271_33070 [Planctomycetes bacterium]|nr:hypothetical protein [Planctomycetota bacterium]